MIDLHYWPTPNGKKVTILLEELAVPYTIVPIHIGRGDQFSDGFLGISPNNRMPAMVDEKFGRFWPQDDLRAKYEVAQWVIWQMANQGPKFGERGHFSRVPESEGDQAYAKRRFNDEVHRLYGVMNNRLYDRPYLAGADYSIADMISYPWTASWKLQGIDLDEFKYFKRWFEELSERPAVQKGMAVTAGEPEDPASLIPEEQARRRSILYNQRARPAPAS
jgi:GST-like protein